ncbi:MAG: ribosome hibernation-promoting factor, HPF/YfiA family [Anaerolineae bacterium]
MLELTIHTRNLELTDWLQSHVEKKIGRMDRYLPVLSEGQVELYKESVKDADRRHVAQVTLRGGRTVIRAEERAADAMAAIDAVVDVLYRQITRYKGKRFDRVRSAVVGGEQAPLPEEIIAELEEEEASPIVRVKQFRMQPMDEEEAIEQMELLGHDFFVFFNANAGRVNVVYRRRDGAYGLLDPELA